MSKRPNRPGSSASGFSNGGVAGGDTLSTTSAPATPLTESRKRQSKRDEAIRRRLESEINKRKNQVGASHHHHQGSGGKDASSKAGKRAAGTVLALRPSPPMTMRLGTSIREAAQFMSAKRENCVLVLDEDNTICGIFTAKDLAFKIVAAGKDAKGMTIGDIMTPNPICCRTDSSATDALNLMVKRGFRHLPVTDENDDIAGVLDITKCFYEAMEKLERAYESSKKLTDALENVQSEMGLSAQPSQIVAYMEQLKQRTEGPDLESLLDSSETGAAGTAPLFVDVRTNVYEAAKLMRQNNTTAVLVTDQNTISGIFTSKDIVLRVIAPGTDPKVCSVVRVMTPQPDFAPKSMSIHQALRKMHEGHYLNLPVMGDDNAVVGIVDVLKLTYATLEQINSMSNQNSDGSQEEGPAWKQFWLSFDDNESVASGHGASPHSHLAPTTGGLGTGGSQVGSVPISKSELAQFNLELEPNDSASRMGFNDTPSKVQSPTLPSTFSFKFKSPSGRAHRVTTNIDTPSLLGFRTAIGEKLTAAEIETVGGHGLVSEETDKQIEPGFAVSYVDEDGDAVAITAAQDIADAAQSLIARNLDRGTIFIHHPDAQIEIPKAESTVAPSPAPEPTQRPQDPELIPGVPNDLLLPGAIAALAVSIILVFTFSRR